jgi:acyl-CoA thioester hydrolase
LAPAVYDEQLKVVTTIRNKPSVRIRFEYEIYNEQEKLIHTGETLLAFVIISSGKPCRPPHVFENVLKPYFG